MLEQYVHDPLGLARVLWPHVAFYDRQAEIIQSVRDDDETVVVAGNMLGKDFVAGFITLWFFLTRSPCRVVTTSAKEDHLRVLWGEIGRYIDTASRPLGQYLVVHHRELRQKVDGRVDKLSYVVGMVAAEDKTAAMQGHHVAQTGDGIPRTLFVADEASGVPDGYHGMAKTWANRILVIGNAWPCDTFFKHAVKGRPGTEDRGGDIPNGSTGRYLRKVIRITATDSPNVRRALDQQARGQEPTGEIVTPGVLSWGEYQKRLKLWNDHEKCVSLNAEFYEGASVLLFPPTWLDRAAERARELRGKPRKAVAIGVDPAEGGDKTAMAAVDEHGLIELVSERTPDTSRIRALVLAFMRKHGVAPESIVFDRGGGGKQIADDLRSDGYGVRSVGFGEAPTLEPRRSMVMVEEKIEKREERYAYVNLRAEMYGTLRLLLDPSGGVVVKGQRLGGPAGFGIPGEYAELRRQLAPIPLTYDREGRLKLLPKNRNSPDSNEKTLTELLGCSPDEADSLVLAVWAMTTTSKRVIAGAR